MAIERINEFDTLNAGREKINKALDDAVTVLKEATDKDVISAPEIILARGGATTLGERLDSEKAEVSAQLAQKVDQVVFDVATSTMRFYANQVLVNEVSVAEAGNASVVQSYIDTLVSDGQIEGVTLADGAVSKNKFNPDLILESNTFIEDNMSDVFELHNKNYFYSNYNLSDYNIRFGAVKELTLIGFDSSKPHRLRLIARNHSSFNYRFIICHRANDGDIWADVFDAGADFTVTENPNGLTTIEKTIGSRTVRMKVDYNVFPNGSSVSDGLLAVGDGRYRIHPSCFYENKTEKVKNDVRDLYGIIGSLSSDVKTMYATKNGKSHKIKFRYGSENLVLEFDELGINQIIHPRRVYKESGDVLTPDFTNPVLWYSIGTDWVSPYSGVTALTGNTTGFSGTVGGNHGTNGASGFPTARSISTSMFADGKIVNDGDLISCDKVIIITKNIISASNKINPNTGEKADSLEEVVTYTVTPNNIEVAVYLTALEDLTINGYTGLQMTTNMFDGQAYFNDGPNKYSPEGVYKASLPLPFGGDRMVYGDEENVIVTYTNRNVGLGQLDAIGSAPIHFLSQFNKLYSHLITNPVTVLQDESIYYSGGYTISVPMVCEGAEKAYFIKYNGVKEYCVDFLAPVENTYFELSFENLGKQIEIVEKSDSITCDELISGKGLKISASDFGTLKFKIAS